MTKDRSVFATAERSDFPEIYIVVVKPLSNIHAEDYSDLAEVLRIGFDGLGAYAKVVENQLNLATINVILGWHLITEEQEHALAPKCILYNLKPLDDKNDALLKRLARLANRCEVWDYSLRNIQILHETGFPDSLRYVPIGTVPAIERIKASNKQNIDVLLYGPSNPRRAKMLNQLENLGLNVETIAGVSGDKKDALIARAKVVLNLASSESNIFDIVQASYLWSNRKAVVAERNQTTELEVGLEDAACFVPYEQLAEACKELVANPAKRQALEQRAFTIMSIRDEVSILRRVLAGDAEVPAPAAQGQPSINPSISLVVNTYNEEQNLQGLFDSCSSIDEIVVADMGSSDKTVEIARNNHAQVVAVPSTGERCCELGRQTALDAACGDWNLVLDGDERLSPGGLDRLRQIIATAPEHVAAYSLAFHIFIGSTPVHATGFETKHERHVRLFRRGRVKWPLTVHSTPEIDGKIEPIAECDAWVNHHKFAGLENFIEKINSYSSIGSRELLEAGKPVSAMAGLSDGLQELVRRYSPEEDGALSFAMAFGILACKLLNHAKAAEALGWPEERLPSQAALARGVDAFALELLSDMLIARPLGTGTAECTTSIVIPVFNKVEFTRQCVASLRRNTPDHLYELIFVDNASTDGTTEFLAGLGKKVKVVTNAENLGFVDACNQGALVAQGKFLLFLNNDTAPQPGWLEALLKMAEGDANVAAVGAKLVYPDGRLQEAGGMIFQDGSGWNFGRFSNPADDRYAKPCEVDYCSGAALLVRIDTFKKLGGFDRRYAPAYYEDTDLCFGIRSLGLKVMYCPDSVVTHFEGATAGTDLNSGFKRYQALNRDKFVAKWREALVKQDPSPIVSGRPPVTSDRARLNAPIPTQMQTPVQSPHAESPAPGLPPAKPGAPHILIVDPMMPLFDIASGSLRLFRIIQLFRVLGCHVTFIARNGSADPRYKAELEALGVVVCAGDHDKMLQAGYTNTFPHVDLRRILTERPCQLAWLSFYYIAEQYINEIRRFSPQTTIVADTVDVHFLRETRQAELAKDRAAAKQAQTTRARELGIYGKADIVVTVTQADADVLQKNGLKVPTEVIPNVHAACGASPGWNDRRDLLFVGNFNHPPNIGAVLWFCREIMPHIRGRLPGVKFKIVGANPPAQVVELATADIEILGWVPETGSHLDAARLSVAPLRVGAGMKGKVGEALSRGLPVVSTSIGAEGMNLQNREHVVIADDAQEFAQAVVELYEDQALWERMAHAGKELVEERYGLRTVMHMLHTLLMQTEKATVAQ